MQQPEAVASQERASKQPSAGKAASLAENLLALKEGRKFDAESLGVEALTGEQRQEVVQILVAQERCSEAFAQRLLSDANFRRRVGDISRNLAESGERIMFLEEVEIFSEALEPGHDSVKPLLESTNPQKRFKGLESLGPEGLRRKRLDDMRKELKYVVDPEQAAQVQAVLQAAFAQIGLPFSNAEEDWQALLSSPERIQAFSSIPEVKTMYNLVTQGKDLDRSGRRIQMSWEVDENGVRTPTVEVKQMALNRETGYVSELGFKIQRKPPREGQTEPRRVMSDVTVIVDKDMRSKNAGAEFLMGNLSLIREYKLQEAEFVANINLGSYVWARISDMDVEAMSKGLTPMTQEALGPKPWDMKKVKGQVFRERIMPSFEGKMRYVIGELMASISDPKKREELQRAFDELMEKQYPVLYQRALAGDLTMDELVNFGRGLDVFRFDEEGESVSPDDPKATNSGHLGKAGIMGIAWKATIPLDTRSMFGLVDRLTKGTGLVGLLKKTGQKIGIALSL